MTFSHFLQFDKSAVQFKILTKLLTALLGTCGAGRAQKMQDLFPLTHGESKQAVLAPVLC